MHDDPNYARGLEMAAHLIKIGWIYAVDFDGESFDVKWSPYGWSRFNAVRSFLKEIQCYPIEPGDVEPLRWLLSFALAGKFCSEYGDLPAG